ncbi:GGDEF domain-containing protein [Sulfitobacter sediminilitoris]|uniref:GGDEF domain-containing protein n=1 Tax=Sulfitobacter sediminilitoris TaxID=2698830 RepID=UPI003621CAE6
MLPGRQPQKPKLRTEQQSIHDPLTQLPNRRAFDAAMVERYQDSRLKSKRHTIIRIDLDHFKFVNDSLGHAPGDAVLVHMAQILRKNIRETDLGPVDNHLDATRVAAKFQEAV